MGHRANYVIIENGQPRIFFSNWGALTVPSVVLSGPEKTLEYIYQLGSDEWLLNDTWAEGGILIDIDAHRALFWGGSRISARPYLRRPLLKILPPLWPSWSIDWALFGVVDLARALGWDISRVLDDDVIDKPFLTSKEAAITEAQFLEALHTTGPTTILTIRQETGEVKGYPIVLQESFRESGTYYHLAASYQVLSLGPQLLNILPAELTMTLPKEGSEQEPQTGMYIDVKTHTIWVWENETLNPRHLEAIERRWPGWQVQGHVEGLYRQMLLSGRDPAPIQVPETQAIQELIAELTRDRDFDPLQLAQAIQQTLPAKELQGVQFGKDFFTNATSPLTSQERREVFERLLLHISENEKLSNTNA